MDIKTGVKTDLKNEIRKTIQKPDWEPGGDNSIPGGRENGKSIVDNFYANVHPELNYKGCNAYADVRELFEKEKDLNAVKIMTPDHLHGVLSMAAMKKGKHVLVHKPLSNRLLEGKRAIAMARSSNVITHLIPWDSNGSMDTVMSWINAGAIGNLRKYITGQIALFGHNIQQFRLIHHPFRMALTGISGWARKLIALIILIIPIWFFAVGMISVEVPWLIWVIIVCGLYLMHYNCRHPLLLNPT